VTARYIGIIKPASMNIKYKSLLLSQQYAGAATKVLTAQQSWLFIWMKPQIAHSSTLQISYMNLYRDLKLQAAMEYLTLGLFLSGNIMN